MYICPVFCTRWLSHLLSKGWVPLIHGVISHDGVPTIDIELGGRRWRAIIDTGFNGELELPEQLIAQVNPQFVGRVTSLLAANQSIEENVYLVDFPFDGKIVRAQATFVIGNDILIGTMLLFDFRLGIDFPARTVLIEKA